MSMYEQFETSASLEQQGITLDYGSFRVRMARAGGANTKYARKLSDLWAPHKRAMQLGAMDEKVAQEILIKALVFGCILDWEVCVDREKDEWKKGIEGRDGEIMPFSTDNLLKTLRELPNLFLNLQEDAKNMTLYREVLREEDAKNS